MPDPLLEIIKALAPVVTIGIALFALWSWQRQDKAKREAEFLDALIDATHTYIVEMHRPISLVEITGIGMWSHAPTWEEGDETTKAVKGAIAYIKKQGEQDSKRLRDELSALQPATIRLRALAAKGQVFSFVGYAKCQKAVELLTREFDKAETLMTMIGRPTLNWDHPEVLASLKAVMALKHEEMRKVLAEKNVEILEFAKDTYKRIYG